MTISRDDYLRLLGLKTLAMDHNRALADLEKSALGITQEMGDYSQHTTDLIYDVDTTVTVILHRLDITVEPQRLTSAPEADAAS